ncbi:DUF3876 domain-containing protein [Parabacteroides sp. Marseille-P3160]|uniref:DUF3876 domain-containing protein n=1 Tax=Parabacteroides sp. Marseille-P3160 TaxID=1917887 RepID=UPI0009BB571F|nr:DUF3876 domain-containing protein [Parabacteroides sp. Marseille-P3160]
MLKRFSNEQLEKLLIHTVGINSILTEVLLKQQEETEVIGDNAHIDILVIDPNGRGKRSVREAEPLNLDVLCGDWKSCKKKPDLLIFKAEPGYMIALGKKPENGMVADCYLIQNFQGNLCFYAGDGAVILSYDKEGDTITLFPGGEYNRVEETKK